MTQFVILCEDRKTYHFARHYLEKSKFHKAKFFESISPRGSGFDYVISQYPKEVDTLRRKNYIDCCLIVIIDGDNNVDYRIRQLQEKVERLPEEKIAIFIPNRNIETWFQYATSPEDCEEGDKDYKSQHKNTKPTQIAGIFADEICQSGWREPLLLSLEKACEEWRELREKINT